MTRATLASAGLALALAGALAGCGDFDPSVAADHDSVKYQADLAACQDSGGKEAERVSKATFPMFVAYPVAFPYEQRKLITRCMAGKGYVARD